MSHASTKSAVLDLVRAAGTISRVGLAQATGLTGATISTVVRRLIDDGLVIETGRAESTGGKPRILLELNQSARFAVGVQLDHSGIAYVLTDLGGKMIAHLTRAGAGVQDPNVVVERMAREVNALIEGVGVDRSLVLGLGVVSPGPLTPEAGMRLTPPSMRTWAAFPLRAALEKASGLPVELDNDATASALGEYWSGGVKDSATFAAVFMSTGIGAGLLVNGTAYRGASGNAGEIGHICLDPDGPECWCGARGCTEAIAGPAAVVAAARADPELARACGLARRSSRSLSSATADFAAIARLAVLDHPGARALLETSARHLAVAIRALVNVMDLDVVVLTGPTFAIAGSIYLPVIQAELDSSFFARATHRVTVQLSKSPITSAAIGAAAMVLQSKLAPAREVMRLPRNLHAEPRSTRGPVAAYEV